MGSLGGAIISQHTKVAGGCEGGAGLLIWLSGQRAFRWKRSPGSVVIRLASECSNGALNSPNGLMGPGYCA